VSTQPRGVTPGTRDGDQGVPPALRRVEIRETSEAGQLAFPLQQGVITGDLCAAVKEHRDVLPGLWIDAGQVALVHERRRLPLDGLSDTFVCRQERGANRQDDVLERVVQLPEPGTDLRVLVHRGSVSRRLRVVNDATLPSCPNHSSMHEA
jgi:hypothetical protein